MLLALLGKSAQSKGSHARAHAKPAGKPPAWPSPMAPPRAPPPPRPPPLPINAPMPRGSVPRVHVGPAKILHRRAGVTPGPRASAQGSDAALAARQLHAYVTALLRLPLGARMLGHKGSPNAKVRELQLRMGGLLADGIYGPATRARGQALIGIPFPGR